MSELAPGIWLVIYWGLIGVAICPPWPWPRPWPGPWPPPPPPWFTVIAILAAIGLGWLFTGMLVGRGVSRISPIIDFAATGAFAAVGALAARAILGPLVTPKSTGAG